MEKYLTAECASMDGFIAALVVWGTRDDLMKLFTPVYRGDYIKPCFILIILVLNVIVK